ncbi:MULTISPECIES: hypothetical protein [Crateriforma]|uniref:hypothetical protein n=1 Tax=Crateriforma TaxID=2714592 RepID=UPI001E5EA054|nr:MULTISPECIES: hypothetical protein [Crateriforma]
MGWHELLRTKTSVGNILYKGITTLVREANARIPAERQVTKATLDEVIDCKPGTRHRIRIQRYSGTWSMSPTKIDRRNIQAIDRHCHFDRFTSGDDSIRNDLFQKSRRAF